MVVAIAVVVVVMAVGAPGPALWGVRVGVGAAAVDGHCDSLLVSMCGGLQNTLVD